MEGGGGGEGGTLHNECSLMNAAAPFLSRARFLVARLLTAFMVTRPNSRKIIYFVTTKKKNRIFPTLLYLYTIYFEHFKSPFASYRFSKIVRNFSSGQSWTLAGFLSRSKWSAERIARRKREEKSVTNNDKNSGFIVFPRRSILLEFKVVRVSAINTNERFIVDARGHAGDISYLLMERNVIRFAETLYEFSPELSLKFKLKIPRICPYRYFDRYRAFLFFLSFFSTSISLQTNIKHDIKLRGLNWGEKDCSI